MIDGHPLEYANGQHGQDSNSSSGGSANWYRLPRSSPSLSSPFESEKRQSALAALEGDTKAGSTPSLVSSASSALSPPSTSSSTASSTASHSPGDKPIISPTTPRGVLTIPTLPLRLPPSSSLPASPTSPDSPHSQMSSSPSTTAFVTPASSLSGGGGDASQQPSTPPSPNPRSSQSQSTLIAVLAALHAQNPSPNPISSVRPLSNRPAPPSPISISRRQSTRSTMSTRSTRSGSGNLSVSKPVSRPVSGLVLFPDVKADANDDNDPASADILSSTTEKPHPSPFFISSSSSLVSSSPIRPHPPRAAIVVRDYAFEATDDRYSGVGPFVPKWNKVERLIRILVDAARNDEEAREKRRRKKERKERKKSERAKRKKKRLGNGWRGSEDADGSDDDYGWVSSESESTGTSDSSDSSNESGDDGGGGLYDEHNDEEGYQSHNQFYQGEHQDPDTEESQEYSYTEEDIPSGPLLPGLYRALYAFEPEGEAEMGLDEGQVVRVVGRGGGAGWAVVIDEREDRVSLGLGGHALVPESYLEVVRVEVDEVEVDDG